MEATTDILQQLADSVEYGYKLYSARGKINRTGITWVPPHGISARKFLLILNEVLRSPTIDISDWCKIFQGFEKGRRKYLHYKILQEIRTLFTNKQNFIRVDKNITKFSTNFYSGVFYNIATSRNGTTWRHAMGAFLVSVFGK